MVAKCIQEQKKAKQLWASAHDKFKSLDTRSMARRRDRDKKKRKRRKSKASKARRSAVQPVRKKLKKQKAKPGSRHVPCHCCGRRKQNCKYFQTGSGKKIEQKFNANLFDTIPPRVAASDIQTWRDTGDMSRYSEQVPSKSGMEYWILFPLALCWRIFSNEMFWDALQKVGAASLTGTPVWVKFRPVMEMFRAEGESFYRGLFYCGNKLRQFRYDPNAPWQSCTACHMDDIDRLIEAMKIAWYVARLMKQDFHELQINPTRTSWRTCTEGYLKALRARTRGMYADYALKKTLDAILISQPNLEQVVSWWPMRCPAYTAYLPKLYPGIKCTQDDLYAAACHYHRQLKKTFPKYRLGDSLAQLCWLERGVA